MSGAAKHWTTRLNDEMVARYRSTGEWRGGTSADRFSALVEADPAAPILIDATQSLDRATLWEHAARLAHAMQSLGIVPGDVISFQLPNWFEAVVIDLAAAMCGAVVNPIVPIYREKELLHILNDSRARILFVPHSFRGVEHSAMVAAMRDSLPWLKHIVTIKGRGAEAFDMSWEELTDQSQPGRFKARKIDANSLKIVMYTSGTTGLAKSVLHSHSTIDAEVRAVARHYSLQASDRVFMPSPVSHITGYLYGMQMPLTFGMTAVFMEQWEKDEAVRLIEQNFCTFTVGATPFLQELCDAVTTRNQPLRSLRYFLCGGAPVPPKTVYDAAQVMEACIIGRVYGSTEAPTVSLGPTDSRQIAIAAETDGIIVGYEVKLLDSDGQPSDREGEIAVRGPELFLSYGDPVRDAECFDAEGFFLTGDLGQLGRDGALVITGRKKDIIIRGGENISAKEIEDVLHTHPLISEAAVVAMPHARLGETCCAFVRLVPDVALSVTDVLDHVAASGLAKQKIPEHVVFLEAFPKTPSGKVLKTALRDLIAEMNLRLS